MNIVVEKTTLVMNSIYKELRDALDNYVLTPRPIYLDRSELEIISALAAGVIRNSAIEADTHLKMFGDRGRLIELKGEPEYFEE